MIIFCNISKFLSLNAMFRFKLPSHGILNVLDFFILLSLRFCQIVEFSFSYEDAVLQDKLQAHPE